jgi:DNA repair protein RecO (recombination protein O)
MNKQKTKAIILKRQNYKESDRLLTLFSDDLGKISAIAKGARKFGSKNLGLLEPFTINDFILSKGRNLYLISEVSPIYAPNSLNAEIIKSFNTESEIIIKLLPDSEPNKHLFATFEEIIKDSIVNPRLKEAYLITKIIKNQGIQPQLNKCVRCDSKVSEPLISISAGGLISESCKNRFPDVKRISKNTVKFWRILSELEFQSLKTIKYHKADLNELVTLLEDYYVANLDINLKSTKISLD